MCDDGIQGRTAARDTLVESRPSLHVFTAQSQYSHHSTTGSRSHRCAGSPNRIQNPGHGVGCVQRSQSKRRQGAGSIHRGFPLDMLAIYKRYYNGIHPACSAQHSTSGTTFADMLRTALKVGAGLAPRRVASGGAAAGAGRRAFSSLQEALVKVTFIDAEV